MPISAKPGLAAFALAALAACSSPDSITDCSTGSCDEATSYSLCTAIRGNGQLVTAHYAALARITEHYGIPDGSAGGSSASITQFILESVKMNPAVYECTDGPCSEAQARARAALLLKSFPGYLMALSQTDEGLAVQELLPFVAKIKEAGIDALLEEDAEAASVALADLLEKEDVRNLVNPELLALLDTSEHPEFHVADILAGVASLGAFTTDDVHIFVRPGLISFESLADKLGRAGSFYAGYQPVDRRFMNTFLDSCAVPGVDKSWFEVMAIPAGEATCGDIFGAMLREYREALLADETSYESRIDEPVGAHLAALVSTSVLTGDATSAFAAARNKYLGGQKVDALGISWSDVKFGYWGAADDLARVAANPRGYDDPKTGKFLSLGTATWRKVLSYSPAEPGLARALELDDGNVSAGGWSDLHPVLALKNMGCEKVVYVTRAGDESEFAVGIAHQFGVSDAEAKALYDLDDADSSYAQSIAEADAVWCTNWNDIDASDLVGITMDAYNADMMSSDPYFTDGDRAYAKVSSDRERRGCSVP